MKELTEFEIKNLCMDCYCPEMHIIRHEIANTPEYLRRYFEELGRKETAEKIFEEIESNNIYNRLESCVAIDKGTLKELKKRWKVDK